MMPDCTEAFYQHYQACPTCHAAGPELCDLGHYLAQLAGMQKHREYLERIAALEKKAVA